MKTPTPKKTMQEINKDLFGTETKPARKLTLKEQMWCEENSYPVERYIRECEEDEEISRAMTAAEEGLDQETLDFMYSAHSGVSKDRTARMRVTFGISGFTLVEIVVMMAGSSILIVAISAKMAGVWT